MKSITVGALLFVGAFSLNVQHETHSEENHQDLSSLLGAATSSGSSGSSGSSLLSGLTSGSSSLANLGAATSGPLSLLNSGANGGAGLFDQAKQFIQTKLTSLLPAGLGNLVNGASTLNQLKTQASSLTSNPLGTGGSSFFGNSHQLQVNESE